MDDGQGSDGRPVRRKVHKGHERLISNRPAEHEIPDSPRQGHAVVRMLPVQPSAVFDPKRRADFLRALSRKASAKAAPGAPAAQADQFLYGGGESSG
jgi:hypothetical protein